MVLNSQQNEIASQAIYNLKTGNKQVFQFGGEAGTGKSVVMYDIFKRTRLQPYEILPIAYTGQAAIIMRTKGFTNATTAHSGLYEVENEIKIEAGSPLYDTYYNAPELETSFRPKKNLGPVKAIFIDEGRMIPNYMKNVIEGFGLPVIVGGDIGQLPPVKDKPAYLVEGDEFPILTELMRQAENDPIVYIARRARRGLNINLGLYGNQVLVIEAKDVTDNMLINSDMVLCGRNKTRDFINKHVREDIYKIKNSLPEIGERMICRKNNHFKEIEGINLANGLIGSVVSIPNVSTFDGKTFQMDFLPDLLHTPFRDLNCDYEYYSTPHELRKYNKYAKGEKFEFAYAITTHLSQGSEAGKGIYFEENINYDIQNNLNYVGATRFKNLLIYVKENRRIFW